MECIHSANVRFIEWINNARVANVAVSVFLIVCNPTYSAFIAVKVVSFNAVVKQITNCAKIFCKLYSASRAFIANALSTAANRTYDFLHVKTTDFMGGFILVMAKTTRVYILATRGNEFAPSNIMLAIPIAVIATIACCCCHCTAMLWFGIMVYYGRLCYGWIFKFIFTINCINCINWYNLNGIIFRRELTFQLFFYFLQLRFL